MTGPRRTSRLLVAGLVMIVAALIVGITSIAFVATSVGEPLAEALTSPSRPTPVDEQLSLDAGGYTVFELVGRRTTNGPVTTTNFSGATMSPESVAVTGPDGGTITARGYHSSSETLTRNEDVYRGIVRFDVPEAGPYQVRVDGPAGRQVVIAPSLGTGFKGVLGWAAAGALSFVTLVLGVILSIVGATRRRRTSYAASPAGWYPVPNEPGLQRYWNGKTWTNQLR